MDQLLLNRRRAFALICIAGLSAMILVGSAVRTPATAVRHPQEDWQHQHAGFGAVSESAGAPMMAKMSRAAPGRPAPALMRADAGQEIAADAPMVDNGGGSAVVETDPLQDGNGRIMRRSGDMGLVVKDVDAALDTLEQAAEKLSGYAANRDASGASGGEGKKRSTHGSIALLVPAKQFAALQQAAREAGDWVTMDSSRVEDITDAFFDAKARISVLSTSAKRVEDLIAKANSNVVPQLLQQGLRISEQLGPLQSQLRRMRDSVTMSTLRVHLQLPADAPKPPGPPDSWSPFRTIAEAIAALGVVLQLAVDGAIWIVVIGGPVAAAGAGLAWSMGGWAAITSCCTSKPRAASA